MTIPVNIPVGFISSTNQQTGHTSTYDDVHPVTSIPASYQNNTNDNGVPSQNQEIALGSGPRSYYEHTKNGTTEEVILLT
jgi:hypothetical protein